MKVLVTVIVDRDQSYSQISGPFSVRGEEDVDPHSNRKWSFLLETIFLNFNFSPLRINPEC